MEKLLKEIEKIDVCNVNNIFNKKIFLFLNTLF